MSNLRYENDAQSFNIPLKLLYISISKFGEDWHSTLHSHKCTELFYVISGQGEFQVEEIFIPVAVDDMVIINQNVEHTEKDIHKSPMEYIVIGVEGGDFLLEDCTDPRYCAFNCSSAKKEILFYIREILNEFEDNKLYHSSVAGNLLEILTIKLLRHKTVSVNLQPVEKKNRECTYMKRYIDSNYTENITLELLAEKTHLNKYYLVHAFTKEFGISPINYLIRKRIKESRHYLTNSNYRITEISQILGFSSASYFSQCFSRIENISPREYRRKMLNS